MKDTVVISKSEYRKLRLQSKAYQKMAGRLYDALLDGTIKDVVEDFRNTNLYSDAFLKDLEQGLSKSSYAK